MRNEVGVRFDRYGNGWGVENGFDSLMRTDLGGDITANDPGEEINLLPARNGVVGEFYGFPECWSEYLINVTLNITHGPTTQWAYPDLMNDGVHTDAWCRNTSNVTPPRHVMTPHAAPLDLLFYEDSDPLNNGTFGENSGDYEGAMFVTQHGSHDYTRPDLSGYQVIVVRLSENDSTVITGEEPFFRSIGPGNYEENWYRPVALAFANCPQGKDCLLTTSDANGTVIAIAYYPSLALDNYVLSPTPTPSPSCSCPAVPSPSPCVYISSPTPVPSPSSCSSCPDCPSCPSRGGSQSGTQINFNFADMLRQ